MRELINTSGMNGTYLNLRHTREGGYPTAMDGGSADFAGANNLPTAMDGGSADFAGANNLPTAMDGGSADFAGANICQFSISCGLRPRPFWNWATKSVHGFRPSGPPAAVQIRSRRISPASAGTTEKSFHLFSFIKRLK